MQRCTAMQGRATSNQVKCRAPSRSAAAASLGCHSQYTCTTRTLTTPRAGTLATRACSQHMHGGRGTASSEPASQTLGATQPVAASRCHQQKVAAVSSSNKNSCLWLGGVLSASSNECAGNSKGGSFLGQTAAALAAAVLVVTPPGDILAAPAAAAAAGPAPLTVASLAPRVRDTILPKLQPPAVVPKPPVPGTTPKAPLPDPGAPFKTPGEVPIPTPDQPNPPLIPSPPAPEVPPQLLPPCPGNEPPPQKLLPNAPRTGPEVIKPASSSSNISCGSIGRSPEGSIATIRSNDVGSSSVSNRGSAGSGSVTGGASPFVSLLTMARQQQEVQQQWQRLLLWTAFAEGAGSQLAAYEPPALPLLGEGQLSYHTLQHQQQSVPEVEQLAGGNGPDSRVSSSSIIGEDSGSGGAAVDYASWLKHATALSLYGEVRNPIAVQAFVEDAPMQAVTALPGSTSSDKQLSGLAAAAAQSAGTAGTGGSIGDSAGGVTSAGSVIHGGISLQQPGQPQQQQLQPQAELSAGSGATLTRPSANGNTGRGSSNGSSTADTLNTSSDSTVSSNATLANVKSSINDLVGSVGSFKPSPAASNFIKSAKSFASALYDLTVVLFKLLVQATAVLIRLAIKLVGWLVQQAGQATEARVKNARQQQTMAYAVPALQQATDVGQPKAV